MFLQYLYLQDFRNYRQQPVVFDAPKTILLGENAQGKSNLLEAIELLATLKSHRTSRDRDLIREEATTAHIKAQLKRELGTSDLSLILRKVGRRAAIVNGETLKRQQDFLGHLNAVQFSSLDLDLVRGGPAGRRVWIDTLLTQLEPVYAHLLHQYGQVLKQRNALIKRLSLGVESQGDGDATAAETLSSQLNLSQSDLVQAASLSQGKAERRQALQKRASDQSTELALWDAQLAATGTRVIRRRARVLERLAPLAQTWHESISGGHEKLVIRYQPNVPLPDQGDRDDPRSIQHTFLEKIQSRALAEYHQHTSLVGPHRDDIELLINQTPARQFGSQGQQRTLVLSLKLAELALIETVIGEPPLLLLDDVLAELDLKRQNQLLETIEDRFQTLITTTHLGAFESRWLKESQILTVSQGSLGAAAAP